MRLWGAFLLLGLLFERSEAIGSSAGSGHIDLGPWGLGGQSLAELVRGRGRFGGVNRDMWVEVRASSANAPVPGGQAVNELTVAVRAKEPIWKIVLSLPERQLCANPTEAEVCGGYRFQEASAIETCDIVPWDYGRLKLPRSSLEVVDVQKAGLIDSCRVNNSAGDGELGIKRSSMTMTIRQDVIANLVTNSWLVFKIKVLNPPETPVDRPGATQKANTWQVLVASEGSTLGQRSLPAPAILPLWMCRYTNWMLTTPCTAKCGGGVRYSVRRLLHPPPANYPRELLINCNEPLSETHACNEDPCVVDCKLGDWTPFADGPCSVTCGQGFQVERRRVVEGPIGKGKLCPPHNTMDVRVRYKECKGKEECKPRCDLAPKAKLYGSCSGMCNNEGGKYTGMENQVTERDSVRVIRRKDIEATLNTCGAEYEKVPCGASCDDVNFFPAESGRLPRIGKWTEMVAVFFLDDIAEAITIEAPEGFQLGKMKGMVKSDAEFNTLMEDNRCLLKSHNFPRFNHCNVTEDKGRPTMRFQLLNALEGVFADKSGKSRRQMYEVKFWVKTPGECPGGFNEKGVCQVPQGSWDWKLHSWSMELGSTTVGEEDSSFNVYSEKAKAWSPLVPIELTEEETQKRKRDFLNGVQEKREEQKAANSGKKGYRNTEGVWVYLENAAPE